MQVRQRPKALVGSSSSLVRMGFAGSNSSLSRPGHVGGRVGDTPVSPVSPLSETTSVISDSDRPLFNLDERYLHESHIHLYVNLQQKFTLFFDSF